MYERKLKWVEQYGSYPAVLDEKDLNEIKSGNFFFARKFDFKHSSDLIERINEAYKN